VRCRHSGILVGVRLSSTPRSTITRLPERASTDRADLYAVLDLGLVGHLGYVRDGAPVVLPMGYGREGDWIYLHASTGGGLAAALDGGLPASP
jgi:nitroimidazol reductase NimA-like FMN-containing flavoprotein (pyridoxamine 5'-phosphate oxidase superfamily)